MRSPYTFTFSVGTLQECACLTSCKVQLKLDIWGMFFPHLKNLPGQSMRTPGAVAPPLRRLLPRNVSSAAFIVSLGTRCAERSAAVALASIWVTWNRPCHREIKPGCYQTWLVDATSLCRWIHSHYVPVSRAPGSCTREAPHGCWWSLYYPLVNL